MLDLAIEELIELDRGATFHHSVTCESSLFGYTADFTIKRGSQVVLEATPEQLLIATEVNPDGIEITLSADQTAALPPRGLYYDLFITSPEGERLKVRRGPVKVY